MSTASQQKEYAVDERLPALWQASDVAQILGISVKTVHRLVREGKLACVQVTTRERRFTYQQVEDYIRSQSTAIRVDKTDLRPVQSPPKKGGDRRGRGERTGVSKACQLDQLREEMRQW
ncbi:MAG: helix-turn-helix domain-containing protein [Desulfomonile tiedjei]|uniref:Helix-turn-helix domain-containing protein n=1 Tax=Desulfomonile tiedjei TaxID=2358 RepID=A0A9D6V2R1_9BACT|nr:helix-turn-helix domain-containing protein [Desulfomonile tiedjei]